MGHTHTVFPAKERHPVPRYGAGTQGRSLVALGYPLQITNRAGIAIAFGELPGDAFGNLGVRQYRALRPCPRPAPPRPSPVRRWKASRQHPSSTTPDRHATSVIPDPDRGSTGWEGPLVALPYHTQRAGLTIIQPTAEKRTGNVSTRSRSAFGKSPAMGEDANWRPPSVSSGEVESDYLYYFKPVDSVSKVVLDGRYDLVPFY